MVIRKKTQPKPGCIEVRRFGRESVAHRLPLLTYFGCEWVLTYSLVSGKYLLT